MTSGDASDCDEEGSVGSDAQEKEPQSPGLGSFSLSLGVDALRHDSEEEDELDPERDSDEIWYRLQDRKEHLKQQWNMTERRRENIIELILDNTVHEANTGRGTMDLAQIRDTEGQMRTFAEFDVIIDGDIDTAMQALRGFQSAIALHETRAQRTQHSVEDLVETERSTANALVQAAKEVELEMSRMKEMLTAAMTRAADAVKLMENAIKDRDEIRMELTAVQEKFADPTHVVPRLMVFGKDDVRRELAKLKKKNPFDSKSTAELIELIERRHTLKDKEAKKWAAASAALLDAKNKELEKLRAQLQETKGLWEEAVTDALKRRTVVKNLKRQIAMNSGLRPTASPPPDSPKEASFDTSASTVFDIGALQAEDVEEYESRSAQTEPVVVQTPEEHARSTMVTDIQNITAQHPETTKPRLVNASTQIYPSDPIARSLVSDIRSAQRPESSEPQCPQSPVSLQTPVSLQSPVNTFRPASGRSLYSNGRCAYCGQEPGAASRTPKGDRTPNEDATEGEQDEQVAERGTVHYTHLLGSTDPYLKVETASNASNSSSSDVTKWPASQATEALGVLRYAVYTFGAAIRQASTPDGLGKAVQKQQQQRGCLDLDKIVRASPTASSVRGELAVLNEVFEEVVQKYTQLEWLDKSLREEVEAMRQSGALDNLEPQVKELKQQVLQLVADQRNEEAQNEERFNRISDEFAQKSHELQRMAYASKDRVLAGSFQMTLSKLQGVAIPHDRVPAVRGCVQEEARLRSLNALNNWKLLLTRAKYLLALHDGSTDLRKSELPAGYATLFAKLKNSRWSQRKLKLYEEQRENLKKLEAATKAYDRPKSSQPNPNDGGQAAGIPEIYAGEVGQALEKVSSFLTRQKTTRHYAGLRRESQGSTPEPKALGGADPQRPDPDPRRPEPDSRRPSTVPAIPTSAFASTFKGSKRQASPMRKQNKGTLPSVTGGTNTADARRRKARGSLSGGFSLMSRSGSPKAATGSEVKYSVEVLNPHQGPGASNYLRVPHI
uniref:Uncharacterized protein n=1 Tax=Eutreptiella gymnastica TaxID=73025 RepID=A0A6T2DLE5_9EUGL